MKKIISLLLSFSAICSLLIPVTATGAEKNQPPQQTLISPADYSSAITIAPNQSAPSLERINVSKRISAFSDSEESEGPMITGVLPTTEDIDTHEIEIDHSILPQVTLYAFCYGATGDVTVKVKNSDNAIVAQTTLTNHAIDGQIGYRPKNYVSFSNGTGAVKTYTIVVSTNTGNAAYAINIGNKETFVESFGGANITTISKTIPTANQASTLTMSSCLGTTSLLETGEMFHYRADGGTYITATLMKHNTLAFMVFDLETGELVYQTGPEDSGKLFDSGTSYMGYVTRYLNLEKGKDYAILFYATGAIASNASNYYQIYIGVPYFYWEPADYTSSRSYSVPANTQKKFTFNVSGFPQSARAEKTIISFNTSSSFNNSSITSCIFTAPNGSQYIASVYGKYSGNFSFDPLDYYGASNTPLNGQWTVTIKTSEPLSGLQFKIKSHYVRIVGKPGD